jgi:hypothetical protein
MKFNVRWCAKIRKGCALLSLSVYLQRFLIHLKAIDMMNMRFGILAPAFALVLFLAACSSENREANVNEILPVEEKLVQAKPNLESFAEVAGKLGDKLQMVPADVQDKKEFAELYPYAVGLKTKFEAVNQLYGDMQTKLDQLEEDARSGKIKRADLDVQLEEINRQMASLEAALPRYTQISDSLLTAYEQMAAGAKGALKPVALQDAAGILNPAMGAGALVPAGAAAEAAAAADAASQAPADAAGATRAASPAPNAQRPAAASGTAAQPAAPAPDVNAAQEKRKMLEEMKKTGKKPVSTTMDGQ